MKRLSLFLVVALLSGCAARAPRAVSLPTVAVVRAPLVAARTHLARSQAVGQQAAVILSGNPRGLSTAQVRQVSALLAVDQTEQQGAQDQLTAALYQTGTLQKELDARQAQIDALARHDAAQTKAVGVLEQARAHWRLAFLLLVVADFFFGAPIQRGLHWVVDKLLSTLSGLVAAALRLVARVAPFALFA